MTLMTRNRLAFLSTIAAIVMLFAKADGRATPGSQGPAQPPQAIFRGATQAVRFDVSPPLTQLARLAGPPPEEVEDEDRGDDPPTGLEGEYGVGDADAAVQSEKGESGEVPTPSVSFDGISNPTGCNGCAPPDPNAAVGPNHIVQMVNLKFQIFNKAGGSLFGPAANNILWSGFGGACQTENAGDPVVLYDKFADRWLLTQFTSAGPTYYNCVALSQTSDPTGAYYRWAFTTGSNFPDYPKYGVWWDGYYITTREFLNGSSFSGIGFYALQRAAMIAGNPNPVVINFLMPPVPAYLTGDGWLPADIDGWNLPPAGEPEFVLGTQDNNGPYGAPSDAMNLGRFHADFGIPGNSTLTFVTGIAVNPFNSILALCGGGRNCVPQPGTAVRVDHLGYRQRPLHRAGYRNFGTYESIITNQSVSAGTGPNGEVSGVRWWELRSPNGSPVIYQQGTYAPGLTDGIHRWMGSLTQDHGANMALGYSASNSTNPAVFPSVYYTGRFPTDSLGQMPQGEAALVSGAGSQTGGSNRWGDYSAMSVDPYNDCAFWYTAEYYSATSTANWNTRIGSFKYPQCEGRRPAGEVDGDFKSDRTVFRPSNGVWYSALSKGSSTATGWGVSTDIDVMADYDGDGHQDIAVFRPSSGAWLIIQSGNGAVRVDTWGMSGDIPLAGDIDGDGKAELAIFRPSSGVWFLKFSTGGSGGVGWGVTGDQPILADYDGDRKKDLVIFRPSSGVWYILQTVGGSSVIGWGVAGDIPVAGDFDGDARMDPTVFRPSDNNWYVNRTTGGVQAVGWGASGDIPVSGDWDGDSRSDFTVFRPSTGVWYTLFQTGAATGIGWGINGDRPIGRNAAP